MIDGGVIPLFAVLYWITLVAVSLAAAVLAGLSWRRGSTAFVYGAAAAVALALLLAAVPADGIGTGFFVHALIAMLSLATAVLGGGPAAAFVLGLATRGSIPDGEHGGILRDGEEVLRGGTTIGVLERLAVAGTLLAGFPEGLAVIVAVKGVGRFSELADSATRERFIIGSLVSFIWACAATGVALLARG